MFQSVLLFIVFDGYVELAKANPTELCASFTENGWLSSDPSKRICFSFYDEPSTWWKAEERCRQEGMFLATPSSESIDQFLWQETNLFQGRTMWIGAINKESKGWKWSNGEPWDYNQINVVTKTLDLVFGFFKKTTSCVLLTHLTWEKMDCNNLAPFACQSVSKHSNPLTDSSTKVCTTESYYHKIPSGRFCFVYHEKKSTWWEANETCNRHGMYLVAVRFHDLNGFLLEQIRRASVKDFWIGGINNANKGWKWTNGEDITFQDFDSLEISWDRIFKDTLCALFGNNGWIKSGCDHLAPFVCQLTRNISVGQPENTNLHGNFRELPAKKIIGGTLNPKLTASGVVTRRTSALTHCVRHCSADKNCVLVNFCQQIGYCALYGDFDSPLNGGATSEIGCSVYMDMEKYHKKQRM